MMKKRLIALALGFAFLIAGFGISYDFDFGTLKIDTHQVKAIEDDEMEPEGWDTLVESGPTTCTKKGTDCGSVHKYK